MDKLNGDVHRQTTHVYCYQYQVAGIYVNLGLSIVRWFVVWDLLVLNRRVQNQIPAERCEGA